MRKITLKNFAKINPVLEVLGRDRDTGMHFVSTVLLNIDHFDLVTVEKTGEPIKHKGLEDIVRTVGEVFVIEKSVDTSGHIVDDQDKDITPLECANESIPTDMTNSVSKAWRALCYLTQSVLPVKITIMKRIPVEAGLGGASGNAAAALVAIAKLFDVDISAGELTDIAASVGMDVPFFLSGGLMHGTHYGEEVSDIGDSPDYNFIILKPTFGTSTGDAYRYISEVLDLSGGVERTPRTTRRFIGALKTGQDTIIHFRNDFDAFALKSNVTGALFSWLQRKLADRILVAGSGSSVVGVFRNPPSPNLTLAALNELDDILECAFISRPHPQGIEVVDWL